MRPLRELGGRALRRGGIVREEENPSMFAASAFPEFTTTANYTKAEDIR